MSLSSQEIFKKQTKMYICQIACYDILTKSQSSLSDKESYPKELEGGREGVLDVNISLANQ